MSNDPVLRVERVHDDSAVAVGACFAVPVGALVVGRDPGCDVVLADPRVSRTHARFRRDEHVWVENLSRRPLYVNEAPVEGEHRLAPLDYVQIGAVLVRLYPVDTTDTRTSNPMAIGAAPAALAPERPPVLVVRTATCEAALFGQPMRLTPAAFAVLATLARQPGAWVAQEALADAIWSEGPHGSPAYVNKYVSYLRAAVAGVLEADPDALAAARHAVRAHADAFSDASAADAEVPTLVRELVKGRKKVGFRLLLGPRDVVVDGPERSRNDAGTVADGARRHED